MEPQAMEPIPFIVGPTAVGKTDLSVALAERLGAEIISADSRQVYRELSVGTAKPTPDEQRGVVHHFVDEVNLPNVVSAGWFERQANERIARILDRGKPVVVVGGSTLYIHALTVGLPKVPPIEPGFVEELNAEVAAGKAPELYAELVSKDPTFAATLDSTKTQRLVRGLSVFRAIGQPLSEFFETVAPQFKFKVIQFTRPRDVLYERINLRVLQMIENGLIEEARSVLELGFDRKLSPLRTIGYRESFDLIDGVLPSEDEYVRLLQRNTRRYAKRQLTWMRRYPENTLFEADRSIAELVERIGSEN